MGNLTRLRREWYLAMCASNAAVDLPITYAAALEVEREAWDRLKTALHLAGLDCGRAEMMPCEMPGYEVAP